ncbi:Dbl homology domain-containing protein [Chlamydoabsidia padenii]|nr:Dbl homology domain-containing protein [Chlamydoabsidia padenii]
MVPRVRLCQSEKCCKKKNHILLDPPEPPPQLLITALHYHNQNVKKKSASHNNLQQQQTSHEKDPATKSPPLSPSICHQEQPTRDDNKLTLDDASYPRRRRSSCPSKYFTNITVQESVMLQSFCSSVNSPQHEPRTSSSSPPSKTAGITTTSSPPPSTITTSSTSSSSSTLAQPDVYDVDNQCILAFSTMKPRSRPLRRRTSGKKEKKAFRVWHDTLVESLKSEPGSNSLKSVNRVSSTSSMEQQSDLSKEKRERMALTRKFILSEIYLTEVTFWNQLYYSKVMFSDPLQKSLEQKSPFVRSSDMDIFSNLSDLMHCSSQLIRAMTPYLDHPSIDPTNLPPEASILSRTDTFDQQQQQYHKVRPTSYSTIRSSTTLPSPTTSTSSSSSSSSLSSSSTNTTFSKSTQSNMLPIHLEADARTLPSPNDQLLLGKELCAMASHFVVFLRCALDYRSNRKRLDHRTQHNKGFAVYQEKLALRRETNQFYVHDYLIIPIQRVTRYGLLLADLQKHTDRNHPDYQYLSRARMILTSLAMAMNKAQQK